MNTHKEQLNILLHKITKDCDCHNCGYCTLIELELANHKDPRMLIQFKLIEKYKYILSQNAGFEISLNDSANQWIQNGYAKKFGDIYKSVENFEDYDLEKLFLDVMN